MPIDFVEYAKNYNKQTDFDAELLFYKIKTLLEHRENLSDCLELGCSDGSETKMIIDNCSRLDVVDASPIYIKMIKESIKKHIPGAYSKTSFYNCLFQDFYSDRQYDTILLSGVLAAIENPVNFLKRVAVWLKPDGVLFITVQNARSMHRRVGKVMGLISDVHELSDRDSRLFHHLKVYDKETLRKDIEDAGLQIRELGGVYLKVLSNAQMEKLSSDLRRAFYELGKESSVDWCAELYAFVEK